MSRKGTWTRERNDELRRLIEDGRRSTQWLARLFQVSEATIRRRCKELKLPLPGHGTIIRNENLRKEIMYYGKTGKFRKEG